MPNTDKVKAARKGGDLKYRQKANAINNANYTAHSNEKRVEGHVQQLRRFEDKGFGVSTGAQFDHEERMRYEKAKREEKQAKAEAFRQAFEHEHVEETAFHDGLCDDENCQGCNMYDLDDIDSYCVDCVQPCETCDTYVITREKVDVPLTPQVRQKLNVHMQLIDTEHRADDTHLFERQDGAAVEICPDCAAGMGFENPNAKPPPPAPPMPPLRFNVGERVRCCMGPERWAAGRIVALYYREDDWPVGQVAPYQVELEDVFNPELIFVPMDDDRVVRRAEQVGEGGGWGVWKPQAAATTTSTSSVPSSSKGAGAGATVSGNVIVGGGGIVAEYWY